MLNRMILATAALGLTTPAMATCLDDPNGAQCDVFLDQYRDAGVPVGTSMVDPQHAFLAENIDLPGFEGGTEALQSNDAQSDNVFYWDGQTAYVVPENSGPPIKIADW